MPEYISTKEAAERLEVSPSRVLKLIKAGRLPATKLGGRDQLIDVADLEKVRHRPVGYPAGRPRKNQED